MFTLEEKLGYRFKNRALLENALQHSSYANEHRGAGMRSNERLEFLGDAVLGVVTADYLYKKHPDLPEGDLTRIRAALVCEESLHEVGPGRGTGRRPGAAVYPGGCHGVRVCRGLSGWRHGGRCGTDSPGAAG